MNTYPRLIFSLVLSVRKKGLNKKLNKPEFVPTFIMYESHFHILLLIAGLRESLLLLRSVYVVLLIHPTISYARQR